jgi:hypothetical protein
MLFNRGLHAGYVIQHYAFCPLVVVGHFQKFVIDFYGGYCPLLCVNCFVFDICVLFNKAGICQLFDTLRISQIVRLPFRRLRIRWWGCYRYTMRRIISFCGKLCNVNKLSIPNQQFDL